MKSVIKILDEIAALVKNSRGSLWYGAHPWDEVANLGAKLIEVGNKLISEAKGALSTVCTGAGTEVCFKPRLVLVWVDPTRRYTGLASLVELLACSGNHAGRIWADVNNNYEFAMPVNIDLKQFKHIAEDDTYMTYCGDLKFRLSTPGEKVNIALLQTSNLRQL